MLKLTPADIADLPARSQYTPVPELPFEMVAKDGYTAEQQRDMAISALKALRTYVTKASRWQIACARGEQLKVSAMPSRAATKQSYDKSMFLAIWLGWDREATRCHALVDQVLMVKRAEEILGA